MHEEGLEARWARHRRNHQALKAGLTGAGPEVLRRKKAISCRSSTPSFIPAGVDDA